MNRAPPGPAPSPLPPPQNVPTATLLLVAELVVLGAACSRVLQVALKPPFRRDLRELPRTWVVLGAAAALAALVSGAWIVVRWPLLRHVAVIIALAAFLATWVRARPTYGATRGLPPGSLGIAASVDAIYDRDYYRNQVQRYGPVFKMSQFGRPVVCVYGLSRARALLAEQAESVTGASLPYNRAVGKGALRYLAARDHQRERPVFRDALNSLDLAGAEDEVRESCRTRLSEMVRASAGHPDGVAARRFLARYLLESLSRVFFGLGPHDPRIDAFEGILPAIEVGRMGGRQWRERFDAALVEATHLMRDIASTTPASRLSGTALGTLLQLDPAALDDATRARNLFMAFRLANGDVTGLLDWILVQLSRHPQWQASVRQAGRAQGEPAGAQPRDIASRVVLETLRLEQSEFLYRRVTAPLAIDGFTIPAGWLVRILVHESHRDPGVFSAPDTFDPDRFLQRAFDKTEYSPFGADVHGCMGARLALFLGRVFVEELCHGVEWSVTADGPLERGTRHRHHWRPSSAFRIAVHGREDATVPSVTAAPDPAARCPVAHR